MQLFDIKEKKRAVGIIFDQLMNFSDNTGSVHMSRFLFRCSQYLNCCVLVFSRRKGRPQLKKGMDSFPFLVEREAECEYVFCFPKSSKVDVNKPA